MPCLLAVIAVFFPRFMILAVAIFSDYLGRAYDNWLGRSWGSSSCPSRR